MKEASKLTLAFFAASGGADLIRSVTGAFLGLTDKTLAVTELSSFIVLFFLGERVMNHLLDNHSQQPDQPPLRENARPPAP